MKDQWKSSEFAARFSRHEDELKWLYYELYHSNGQAFDSFTDMMYRLWEERPEKLKEMDRTREMQPEWYRGHDMTGMLMYTNAFAGTLKGVKKKLKYIIDCGVNYLQLMPLLESPEGRNDGGYAVSDFRKVQPELGTMEDLSDLADACHAEGIAVCLDFVMNHTSEDHEWAKAARAGDEEMRKRYFDTRSGFDLCDHALSITFNHSLDTYEVVSSAYEGIDHAPTICVFEPTKQVSDRKKKALMKLYEKYNDKSKETNG